MFFYPSTDKLRKIVFGASLVFAIGLLGLVVSIHVSSFLKNQLLTPVSPVEETAYTYISARNFLKYGFKNSGWLQDFSTSSNPSDHPFVYNHMPPGPDITTAFLLKISDGSYRFLRLTWMIVFLAGIFFYFRFLEIILRKIDLTGAGFALLWIGPTILWESMERSIYSPWLLFCFAPLVFLQDHNRTQRRSYLWFAWTIVFLSSLYLEYFLQIALCIGWFLLYSLRIVKIHGRYLLVFFVIVALGFLLHEIQNCLFFGPKIFFQEFNLVLSNRILGVPSRETMAAFYESNSIVHHGTRALDWGVWKTQFFNVLTFPIGKYVLSAFFLIALIAASTNWHQTHDNQNITSVINALIYISKVWFWIAGTLVVPMLIFPSFAQEYNLRSSNINLYFLAMGALLTVECFVKLLYLSVQKMNHLFSIKRFLKWCVLGMVSLIVCVGGVCILIGKNIARYHQIVEIHRKNLNADFDDLHKYQGHVFVTNVNSPTVGFFMQEAGYGVCSPDVISQEGIINAAECKIAFFKMSPKRPEYFVLFDDPQFFPGFSNWIPSSPEGREGLKLLKLRLASHFPLVHKNRIFEVYDLHKNVE